MDAEHQLVEACSSLDEGGFRAALEGAEYIDRVDASGWGGIAWLIEHPDDAAENMSRELIGAGCDPDLIDAGGVKPLHWAITYRRERIARQLLKAGADPNSVMLNLHGGPRRTPVQLCLDLIQVREGDQRAAARVLSHLLKYGADPLLVYDAGQTPIDVASSGYCPYMTIVLLAYGIKLGPRMHGMDRVIAQGPTTLHPGLHVGYAEYFAATLREHLDAPRMCARLLMYPPTGIDGPDMTDFELPAMPGLDRRLAVARWRVAHSSHRDAGLALKAAREGRPMELAKRLRLGIRAGALAVEAPVAVQGASGAGTADGRDRQGGVCSGSCMATAAEAAWLGGHDECLQILTDAAGLREPMLRASFVREWAAVHGMGRVVPL